MKSELKKCYKNSIMVCFYCVDNDFISGYINAFTEEFLLIFGINKRGEYNGYILISQDNIKNDSLTDTLLNYTKSNKIIMFVIFPGEDTGLEYGFVQSYDNRLPLFELFK